MCITKNQKLQITFKSVEFNLGYDENEKDEEKINFKFENPIMNKSSTSNPELMVIFIKRKNLFHHQINLSFEFRQLILT